MSVEQSLHASILNSLDTTAPAVLLVSQPGLGAVSQTRNALEQAANELDMEVKMSGHTNESISYIEILARDLNEEHSFGFGTIPVATRLQSALDGRHTVVMIDSSDATQNDLEVVVELLNTRSYNGVDLANAHLIVLARDENIAQKVDHIQVLVNEPAPVVSKQPVDSTMGQLLTPDVSQSEPVRSVATSDVTGPQTVIKKAIDKKRAAAAETPEIDISGHKNTL